MDLQFLLDRVPMNAYNKGYGDEVQNQLRQAQGQEAQIKAQQLIQEMMMKQEMAPIERAYKEAMTANYNSMAQGTGHYAKPDNSDKAADILAKAKERETAGQFANAVPTLERYRSILNDESAPKVFPQFQGELDKLPPELQRFFGTKDNMQLSTDLLKEASDYARSRHPELRKDLDTRHIQASIDERSERDRKSREKISSDKIQAAREKAEASAKSAEADMVKAKDAWLKNKTPDAEKAYKAAYNTYMRSLAMKTLAGKSNEMDMSEFTKVVGMPDTEPPEFSTNQPQQPNKQRKPLASFEGN